MKIPLTRKYAENVVFPALFLAVHVYSPEWWAWTSSILNWFTRCFVFIVFMPSTVSILFPFRLQNISIGKSPLITAQVVSVISPEFTDSLPKSNGWICGGTLNKITFFLNFGNNLKNSLWSVVSFFFHKN